MTCARTGSVEAVTALLAQGADPNATELWQGQTALMWAAAEAHTGVVRALIDHGATISARSTNGYTAILIAARKNTPKLIQLLLEAGAGVNDASPDGMTPLLVATVRGHAELVSDLLERGADPNASGPGYTALHWVSGAWHTELTGILQGIDVGREKEWLSLNEFSDDGKVNVVESLLQHGANVNVRLERKPPQYGFASGRFRVGLIGATPFWLAAMDGNVALMRMLSEAGADATLGTDEETSPLMVAAGLGQVPAETRVMPEESLAAVEFALSLGANVNRLNAVGRAALHGAAHIRSDEIVQVLVDHGAAVNAADQRGITPLMIAEGGGHILLPGLGGGSTADLLRSLGGNETRPEDFINSYREGPIR
jgi:ankyrin repeat protein